MFIDGVQQLPKEKSWSVLRDTDKVKNEYFFKSDF